MRKYVEVENGRGIWIADNDGQGIPDIGIGMNYSGKASYIAYCEENIDDYMIKEVYARKNGIPLEIARTKRFVIREMTVDDLPECYELYETLKDCPYIEPLYEYEKEKEFTEQYIANMYAFFGYGLWLVFDKCTGELAARIGIENRTIDGNCCQELGYLVKKSRQRQGIAYEVCSAVIELAHERYGLKQLYICTDNDNIPSALLAEKLGFGLYAQNVGKMNIYKKTI